MLRRQGFILLLGTWLFGATPAGALTLGFDDFVHGEFVDASQGVTITTENFNPAAGHPDQAVAFDTRRSSTSDPDLEQGGGWARGNLAADNVALNDILIIQENDRCENRICEDPDDEGRRDAGRFSLDYSQLGSFQTFAFDLVDVESASVENGSLEFRLDGAQVNFFDFGDFLGLGQGVEYGNNSANRIDLGDVGIFDEVIIRMGGSGGVDNIVTAEVPEPSTLVLCGLGLAGLAVVGRRRRRRWARSPATAVAPPVAPHRCP